MAEIPPLDDALRARFAAAREAERTADLTEPRAREAYYDAGTGRIVVELKLGGAFAFPVQLYPELAGRSPEQLAAVQPAFGGEALEWEDIDVHIGVAGVLVRMLGPALPRAFAQRGGASTSDRKAAAARANGARGGRPRKQPGEYRPDPNFGVMKVAEVRQPLPFRGESAGSDPPPSTEAEPK